MYIPKCPMLHALLKLPTYQWLGKLQAGERYKSSRDLKAVRIEIKRGETHSKATGIHNK